MKSEEQSNKPNNFKKEKHESEDEMDKEMQEDQLDDYDQGSAANSN